MLKAARKKKKLRAECDRLFKQVILKKYKSCEVCSGSWQLTAHHYFPRSMAGFIVYLPENGVCLCGHCHFAHHFKGNPLIHQAIMEKRGIEWFNELALKAKEKHASFKTIMWYQEAIENLINYLK